MGQYVEREEEPFLLRGALQPALCLERKKKRDRVILGLREEKPVEFVFCLWTNIYLNYFSLLMFVLYNVLLPMHTSLLYLSNSQLQCVDVDRRKGLGGAQSRSAGGSLLLTVPPTKISPLNTKAAQCGFKNTL